MNTGLRFVQFTRVDNSPVLISVKEIVTCAPVSDDSRLEQGTRITFRNGGHQDVKELAGEVRRILEAAV